MRQLFYVQLQANHEEQKNQAKFAPGSDRILGRKSCWILVGP